MSTVDTWLDAAGVHADWRALLIDALAAVDPGYLDALAGDPGWLPGPERLLAAFRRDFDGLRYLLIGESPYPRAESANGIAFYDAAVDRLWSDTGLGKGVNRATSLRHIVKTALLAENRLDTDASGAVTQAAIAAVDKRGMIDTLPALFANLERAGFLLLNATPVLHPERKPAQEARYWRGFLDRLLAAIGSRRAPPPTLLLWGKIAAVIYAMSGSNGYPRIVCEHPYNLSFVTNPDMLRLFADLRLLDAAG